MILMMTKMKREKMKKMISLRILVEISLLKRKEKILIITSPVKKETSTNRFLKRKLQRK